MPQKHMVSDLELRMLSMLSETEYSSVRTILERYLNEEPKKFMGKLYELKDLTGFSFATGIGRITIDPRFFNSNTILRDMNLAFSISAPIDVTVSTTVKSSRQRITLKNAKKLLEQASTECFNTLTQIGIKEIDMELWFAQDCRPRISDAQHWIETHKEEVETYLGKSLENLLELSYFDNGSVLCKCFHPTRDLHIVLGPSSGIEPLLQQSHTIRQAIRLLSDEIDKMDRDLESTIKELSLGFQKLTEKKIDELVLSQSKMSAYKGSDLAGLQHKMRILSDTVQALKIATSSIQPGKKLKDFDAATLEFGKTYDAISLAQVKISGLEEKLSSGQTLLNNIINLSSIRANLKLQERAQLMMILDILIAVLLFFITILQIGNVIGS